MKTLIIAEKPSQASEYAKALGGFQRKNGYFESPSYYLTWCFGHLVELERDNVYRQEVNWSKDYLPLIPEVYQYNIGKKGKEVDEGKEKQLKIIQELINNSNQIINATDADREAELIFLYVYNYLKCQLPYKRLWISSLTEKDIKNGFNNLLSPEDVKNLGKSAYARAIADWLIGINGTQACTLQFGNGSLLTIGRVQTVILKIICERFIKNKNFQKTFSYKIKTEHSLDNDSFFSESDVFETKKKTTEILSFLSEFHKCVKREEKRVKENTPLLHSIDSLIIETNKVFGYTSKTTLEGA